VSAVKDTSRNQLSLSAAQKKDKVVEAYRIGMPCGWYCSYLGATP